MPERLLHNPRWWTWRRSAQWRLASLASAWLLVAASPVLGVMVLPLFALRCVVSTGQTWLNLGLGKVSPIGGADRFDWTLIVLFCGAAEVMAIVNKFGPEIPLVAQYAPLLVPFSVLQVRMARRSFRAEGKAVRLAHARARLDRYAGRPEPLAA